MKPMPNMFLNPEGNNVDLVGSLTNLSAKCILKCLALFGSGQGNIESIIQILAFNGSVSKRK